MDCETPNRPNCHCYWDNENSIDPEPIAWDKHRAICAAGARHFPTNEGEVHVETPPKIYCGGTMTEAEFDASMAETIKAMKEEVQQRALRGQETLKKYRFIPFAEFETRFGITERDEEYMHPTDIGELQFWSYHDADTEIDDIPLEDIAGMIEQIHDMVLFGYMELGNDTNTVRPHVLFPDWFTDGSAEYTDAFLQRDVDEYEEQLQHLYA